ncbi:hypothetical protein KIJ96_20310 (plasmid) [Pseudoalteromonas piscicida]|uniref:hypothetical protein n=1 Tax=Pseudoalteromonas TaxID=53246 RepID=UPI00110943FD|nr:MULTISPECIES: hypothetical protein [Pseudoalteromonas]NKC21125.1 hypothetical protein [Pseudoalteromonas galatheae]UDM64319.1 hypothetical protein KIJ96_20310 [Pseudoalteromonas piscicida]
MSNNLFISYDLNSPGQDYEKVIEKIKSLGSWAKVQKSLWFVSSSFTPELAAKSIWSVMDNNDSLIVVDAKNNDAYWFNLSDEVSKHIQNHWSYSGT